VIVGASWVAIVATSRAYWSVHNTQSTPAFSLRGGDTRSFTVTLRPSSAISAAKSASELSASLNVIAIGAIAGTPRPAALKVTISTAEASTRTHRSGINVLRTSLNCAATTPCAASFRVTVRWPDGPPTQVTTVTLALAGEVSGVDQFAAPAGTSVAIDVVPDGAP
jgi:hypothetical protein